MEQPFIDFSLKTSELIFYNRLTPANIQDPNSSQTSNPSQNIKFPLDQKHDIIKQAPPQWASQKTKSIIIEIYLLNKTTNEKFVVELWNFEFNQIYNGKHKNIAHSSEALEQKLSVLLRSISLLTVTLPVYKNYNNDKDGYLCKYFSLEYNINYSRTTLLPWHPSLHEERNLGRYKNPEVIFKGTEFNFYALYAKSFEFLQKTHVKKLSFDKNYHNLQHFMGKSTSDSYKVNTSYEGSASPKGSYFGSDKNSQTPSPVGSMFYPSPIETQNFNSRHGRKLWKDKNSIETKDDKFETVSDDSGEYDMYVYENEEFTEIMSASELDFLEGAQQRKFSMHPRGSDDRILTEGSKDMKGRDLKLSKNAIQVEKLVEQSDDDKLAELIRAIDEVKDCYQASFTKELIDKEKTSMKSIKGQAGFKFCQLGDSGDLEKNVTPLAQDYEDLRSLYSKLST